MGKFNDPAIMLQPLSVLSLLWNSQDFSSFHMAKFKQIQFGALNQGTIGSAHLLLCVVMYHLNPATTQISYDYPQS